MATSAEFAFHVIAPVALCVFCGWVLGRYRDVKAQSLAKAGVDIFGPALLLSHIPYTLTDNPKLVVVLLGTVAGTWALATFAANLLNIRDRDQRTGVILGSALCNFGFFGLPVVESALGGIAFESAMAVLVILNIPTGFLSAYFSSPKPSTKAALKFTFSTPFNWAIILAIILGVFKIHLPDQLLHPMRLLAGATIPVGLVVLGVELSIIRMTTIKLSQLGVAIVLRLLIAPLLVIVLAVLLGFDQDKILAQSAVLQMATPAGITPLIFMASVGRSTKTLAAIVFWSTLLSMLTIPMIAILVTQ